MHLLASLDRGATHDDRLFDVLEHQANGLEGETVGEVVRVDRDVGLGGVRQCVHSGVRRNPRGQVGGEHRVNDRDGGRERVVGERVLAARLGVRDDRERRHLGAGARRGRDADQLGELAQLGELERALADVEELLLEVREHEVGVLVHEPHDLRGVHG